MKREVQMLSLAAVVRFGRALSKHEWYVETGLEGRESAKEVVDAALVAWRAEGVAFAEEVETQLCRIATYEQIAEGAGEDERDYLDRARSRACVDAARAIVQAYAPPKEKPETSTAAVAEAS